MGDWNCNVPRFYSTLQVNSSTAFIYYFFNGGPVILSCTRAPMWLDQLLSDNAKISKLAAILKMDLTKLWIIEFLWNQAECDH